MSVCRTEYSWRTCHHSYLGEPTKHPSPPSPLKVAPMQHLPSEYQSRYCLLARRWADRRQQLQARSEVREAIIIENLRKHRLPMRPEQMGSLYQQFFLTSGVNTISSLNYYLHHGSGWTLVLASFSRVVQSHAPGTIPIFADIATIAREAWRLTCPGQLQELSPQYNRSCIPTRSEITNGVRPTSLSIDNLSSELQGQGHCTELCISQLHDGERGEQREVGKEGQRGHCGESSRPDLYEHLEPIGTESWTVDQQDIIMPQRRQQGYDCSAVESAKVGLDPDGATLGRSEGAGSEVTHIRASSDASPIKEDRQVSVSNFIPQYDCRELIARSEVSPPASITHRRSEDDFVVLFGNHSYSSKSIEPLLWNAEWDIWK